MLTALTVMGCSGETGGDGTLQALGADVSQTAQQGAMPGPEGGTLGDGTYDLVARWVYDGISPSSSTMRLSVRFSNGARRLEFISIISGQTKRGTADISVSPGTITETPLSPPEWVGRTEMELYSTKGTDLWFSRQTEVLVLRRQGT